MRKSQKVRAPIYKGPPGPKGSKGDVVVVPVAVPEEQFNLFQILEEPKPEE